MAVSGEVPDLCEEKFVTLGTVRHGRACVSILELFNTRLEKILRNLRFRCDLRVDPALSRSAFGAGDFQ